MNINPLQGFHPTKCLLAQNFEGGGAFGGIIAPGLEKVTCLSVRRSNPFMFCVGKLLIYRILSKIPHMVFAGAVLCIIL